MAATSTSTLQSSSSSQMLPLKTHILKKWEVPNSERTSFQADATPYLVTTEKGQTIALESLKKHPPTENGVFLGFSLEFNYNILANRKFKRAIICDINKRMHEVYQWISEEILNHETPDTFLQKFRKKIGENPEYFCNLMLGPQEVYQHYSEKPFMWTADPEKYQRVKELYRAGLITHVNLNLIDDSEYFDQLKSWADRNGYIFDCIYVSNIPEWAQRQGYTRIRQMKTNLLKVTTPCTIFIDAKQEGFESKEPVIRISTGIDSLKSFPSFVPGRQNRTRSVSRGRPIVPLILK